MNQLLKKINKKKVKVGIIGLGYVGLPLVKLFVKNKIEVLGVDLDNDKIKKLQAGDSYISSNNLKDFQYFKFKKKNVSQKYKILKNADIILICLPTPLKKLRPDMSFLYDCAKKLSLLNLKDKMIILESTVFPGATETVFNLININNEYNLGKNIFVGYSPERENPGDKNFTYNKTPKVVSGKTRCCLKLISNLYKLIVKKVVKAKSVEAAETSKLLENLYRSVNIGLVNELKIICEKINLDIFEIIDLASTKNFGFQKFLPGPGLGGHCIPIDPYYLSWISKKHGYDPKFIRLSGNINRSMPQWVIKKMLNHINKKKPKILILGIAYKKNVDDDRESPSFEIMKILKNKKIYFDYNDPYFPSIRKGRNINIIKNSVKLTKSNLRLYDAILVVTDHDDYDYKFIYDYSNQVFDARGVYKKFNFKNIIYC